MVDAFSKYYKIFTRERENDAMLQDCIIAMRQLYIEIKEIVRKNRKCKAKCQSSINYMDLMIKDHKAKFTSDDFPVLYDIYVGLLDMLLYIGLTDIESQNKDPGQALEDTSG